MPPLCLKHHANIFVKKTFLYKYTYKVVRRREERLREKEEGKEEGKDGGGKGNREEGRRVPGWGVELLACGSESTLPSEPASASDSSEVQPALEACRSGQGDCVAPKSSSSRYTLTIVKADSVSWSGSPSRSTCLPLSTVGAELGCSPPKLQGTSQAEP